jgi:hypothetical protein
MLRLLDLKGEPVARLPELFVAQLNDTHPSIAVAELMRLLVDERRLPWAAAGSPARARQLPAARRLSRLCRRAERGRTRVSRSKTLGPHVNPQHRTRRQVLVRPGDP